MSGVAEKRIMEERKQWRIDHPPGFFAKFSKNKDDSQNMMVWETGIPGREGTALSWMFSFCRLSTGWTLNYALVLHLRYRLGGCSLQHHHSFQQRVPLKGMPFTNIELQILALFYTTPDFVTLSFSRHSASLHLQSGIRTCTQMVISTSIFLFAVHHNIFKTLYWLVFSS